MHLPCDTIIPMVTTTVGTTDIITGSLRGITANITTTIYTAGTHLGSITTTRAADTDKATAGADRRGTGPVTNA